MKYIFTIVLCGVFFSLKPYISEAPVVKKPTDVKGLIVYYAKQYGVSAPAMEKVIQCESSGNPMAVKITPKEQSYGIVQINRIAHPDISIEKARDIDFATEYLAKNLKAGKKSMWYTCTKGLKV